MVTALDESNRYETGDEVGDGSAHLQQQVVAEVRPKLLCHENRVGPQ